MNSMKENHAGRCSASMCCNQRMIWFQFARMLRHRRQETSKRRASRLAQRNTDVHAGEQWKDVPEGEGVGGAPQRRGGGPNLQTGSILYHGMRGGIRGLKCFFADYQEAYRSETTTPAKHPGN